MKKALLAVLLGFMAFYGSGCATILGGIIGYQSGEAVAGAAIGAAIDFGPHIVNAIGEMLEGEKEQPCVEIDTELGYIRVDRERARSRNLTKELKRKFEDISWQCGDTCTRSTERGTSRSEYRCQTAEGREFTMEIFSEKCQDLRIYIRTVEASDELKSMITSQVGVWAREIMR